MRSAFFLHAPKSYTQTLTAWMKFATPKQHLGEVTFELYGKSCPLAVENFFRLCAGDLVLPGLPTEEIINESTFKDHVLPQLHYKGSSIHRIAPDYVVQGGDIGLGENISVFGESFDPTSEIKAFNFDRQGLLGTAVAAPSIATAQWFVLLADSAPHLNGHAVCFGRVTRGLDVFRTISKMKTDHSGRPFEPIYVEDCGGK